MVFRNDIRQIDRTVYITKFAKPMLQGLYDTKREVYVTYRIFGTADNS